MKKGDRAGAIYRINRRTSTLTVGGFGEYQGEKIEPGKLQIGPMDNIIKLDNGKELDTNTCYSWGTEEIIKQVIQDHKKRSYTIVPENKDRNM
ncbi:MAG: hypothetical protein WAW23_08670 [Candidatus Methanoperedens sp.]